MPDADDNTPGPDGPRTAHRITITGDATAPVVAGNHNLVVSPQGGSRVTVLMGPERPRPRRRPHVSLLPRRVTEPVGREETMRALAAAVGEGGPVQLWGPPGIGKTTLLRHAARHLPPGDDGVVFLGGTYRDVGDLAQALFEACYEALDYAPTRSELRRLMTGVRVTVYADDVGLTADQLSELWDSAPDATFVIASTGRSLWGDGTALELGGLTPTACFELLAREVGDPLPPEESAAADALCLAAAGAPLLLLRAAAVARSGGPDGGRLPRPGEVAALLPALLEQLSANEAAMAVLHLLATLDGAEIAAAHLETLAGVAEAEPVCDRLVRLGLAQAGEHGYSAVADTVPALRRRYAAPFSAERLCGHFTDWASRRTTTPAELAEHGRVLERVAELAEAAGRPDLAVLLARASSPGLARSLRFGVWGRLLGRGWLASRAAGDRRSEAFFLSEEAIRALLIGRRVVYTALLAQSAWLGYELGPGDGGSATNTAAAPDTGAPPAAPDTGTPPADPGTATPPADPGTATPPGYDGGSASDADIARPDFDVDAYMAENGFGPTDPGGLPGAPGHGPADPPPEATGGDSLWGDGVPGDGAAAGVAPPPPSGGPDLVPAQLPDGGAGAWGGATTASSSGSAAGAGAGAGAGATASTVVSSLLSVVIGGLLVAGLGYTINSVTSGDEDFSSQSGSGDTATWDEESPDTGWETATEEAETDSPDTSWAPTPEETEPAWTNDLAGIWETDLGMMEFVESAPGTYQVEFLNPAECGGSYTVEFHGSDGYYTGTERLINLNDPCGDTIGEVASTIVVDDDGATAEYAREIDWTVGEDECYGCGTVSMTRWA